MSCSCVNGVCISVFQKELVTWVTFTFSDQVRDLTVQN